MDGHPLLFFYDCETTGFSVYNEHITEIAAKVVGFPLSLLSRPAFSSLVMTTRNIPKVGEYMYIQYYGEVDYDFLTTVSRITGITTSMLSSERPPSVVLSDFLQWLLITTDEVTESTDITHYPG